VCVIVCDYETSINKLQITNCDVPCVRPFDQPVPKCRNRVIYSFIANYFYTPFIYEFMAHTRFSPNWAIFK
jgi:hypothetical protein